ncbi:MAG TPA: PQQ-binding-like beta-propeller repeat protein [Planctomycetota bacterium]|nr:PQQ-binding-like beta-propeller repeat protein [Planctomycetota bacterium]
MRWRRSLRGAARALCASSLVLSLLVAEDGEPPAPVEFDQALLESTAPLRTALYHDPSLDAPLAQLVEAWRDAGKLEQLVAVYEDHCLSYPDDPGSAIVRLRLLHAAGDPAAARVAREAVARFPDDPFARHLAWRVLSDARDADALAELERAVELEPRAWRRKRWSEELVRAATLAGKREVVERHLRARAERETRPDQLVAVARAMADVRLHEAALATLAGAAARAPDTETAVEIELVAAACEAASDRRDAAALRLDRLGERIGPEHWRRAEVARRRLALAQDGAERERLLAEVRARLAAADADEAAVLDGARILAASGHVDEALVALRAAERRLGGERIEREIDAAFDRRRDEAGRAAWLGERMAGEPERLDLAWRRCAALAAAGLDAQAQALIDETAGRAAEDARGEALAGLARTLRKASAVDSAALAYRRALALDPARLDLRRELGECLVALGRTREVRALFADPGALAGARTVAAELLLDALPFLERLGLVAEAEALAGERLAADPEHFEIRLACGRLARRVGEPRRAEALFAATRDLADTPARYRAWLDAMLPDEAEEGVVARAIDAERALVATAGDGADAWQRVLILADTARLSGAAETARAILVDALARGAPDDIEPALRRALVACLTGLPERRDELAAELQVMAERDPEARDEAMLRLSLEHGGDLGETLEQIDLGAVREVELLDRALARLREGGDVADGVAVAGRLVELSRSEAARWRTWLALLASAGDERVFRIGVRRLLAGELQGLGGAASAEVRADLVRHLGDSVWRQVARALAADAAEPVGEALEALAELAEGEPDAVERAWIPFARARLALRAGDAAQADAAVGAFLGGGDDVLALPDGLTIAADEARRLLRAPIASPPAERGLPLPPFAPAWVVRHDQPIAAIVAAGGTLVVVDRVGAMAGFALASGRRRWRGDGCCAPSPLWRWDEETGQQIAVRPAPVVTLGGMVMAGDGAALNGIDAATGVRRWRADFAASIDAIAAHQGSVVVACATDGVVAALDPATGKRRWAITVAVPTRDERPGLAAIDGARCLFYGRRTALVDLDRRAVLWHLDPARVRPVDVRLEPPATTTTAAAAAPVNASWGGRRRWAHGGGRSGIRRHAAAQPAGGLGGTAAAVVGDAAFPGTEGGHRLLASLALPLASDAAVHDLRLCGGVAVLLTDAGALLAPLEMPGLATAVPPQGGTLLGQVGMRAIYAAGGAATLVGADGATTSIAAATALADDARERAAIVAPEEEPAAAMGPPMAAFALDGGVLYAATADGVAGFTLADGARLFVERFPPSMREALRETRTADEGGFVQPALGAASADGVLALSIGGTTVVGLRSLRGAGAGAGPGDGDAIP